MLFSHLSPWYISRRTDIGNLCAVCVCVCAARRRQSARRLQATALPISGCRFHSCCCYYCCWNSGKMRQRDSALQLFNCWTSNKTREETMQEWVAVVETLSSICNNHYHSRYISPPTGNLIPVFSCLLSTKYSPWWVTVHQPPA